MEQKDLLAKSLIILKRLQDDGHIVFHSTDEIPRINLGCLLNNGFLTEVIRGWYIVDNPSLPPGSTVTWFSNFWKFISIYESYNNGNMWCLSPEQTIEICSGNSIIPNQVTIYVTKGGNRVISLLHNTYIFEIRKDNLPDDIVTLRETGINLWPLESAVANISISYWSRDRDAMMICLNNIRDLSKVTRALIENKSKQKAGYIIDALNELGRYNEAEEMKNILERFNIKPAIQKKNGTQANPVTKTGTVTLMWNKFRKQVLELDIPAQSGSVQIQSIEEKYKEDAYNSLSIEGYKVSQELIDKVSSGDWNPKDNETDMNTKNALVTREYYQAFQSVKTTIMKVVDQKLNPGTAFKREHTYWYIDMWQPFVAAGIYNTKDVIGYRNEPVYIRNSRHVPPSSHKVLDYMDELFECLETEDNAFVRAVLGHFIFTWIHPYRDGNGRMARFLMNTMLTTGNYPWVVIPVEIRDSYMAALEKASVDKDITDFANIIIKLLKEE